MKWKPTNHFLLLETQSSRREQHHQNPETHIITATKQELGSHYQTTEEGKPENKEDLNKILIMFNYHRS